MIALWILLALWINCYFVVFAIELWDAYHHGDDELPPLWPIHWTAQRIGLALAVVVWANVMPWVWVVRYAAR